MEHVELDMRVTLKLILRNQSGKFRTHID